MDAADFKDLPKKYAHTYFQYRPIGADVWKTCYAEDFRIWWAEDDTQVDCFMVYSKKEWYKSTEYEFKFDFPPIGVLNYKETVVITSKYPARQWKKAATHENYSVYIPTKNILEALYNDFVLPKSTSFDFTWDTASVNELFNNKFFTYKEALLALQAGKKLACAITNEFFVTNSHYNKSILLWRYNTIVAEIQDTYIFYVEPLFKQETIDFFKRNT